GAVRCRVGVGSRGARPLARVRRPAPSRLATPRRRFAVRRRSVDADRRRGRVGRPAGRDHRDDPDPPHQPPVVPLDHGAVLAVRPAGTRCRRTARTRRRGGGDRCAADDVRRAGPRSPGGLVTARASFARRRVLAALGAGLAVSRARSAPAADESFYPPVVPGVPLAFPRDHGAHPAYRTEWWYLTGWLRRLDGARRGEPLGVQVTFFRSRTRHAADNPSRFAPTQLLLAHAALAVPGRGRLVHAQRAARAGFGLASAATHDTAVGIGGWSLSRSTDDRYRARVDDRELAVTLELAPQTAPVAQGDRGFSRKGPRATQA